VKLIEKKPQTDKSKNLKRKGEEQSKDGGDKGETLEDFKVFKQKQSKLTPKIPDSISKSDD